MSSAAVNSASAAAGGPGGGGVDKPLPLSLPPHPQHSAFSAVVRKSFSSFSVDSILASPPADARPVRTQGDAVIVPLGGRVSPGRGDPDDDDLPSRDDLSPPPPRGSHECDVDEDDDEDDIHVDCDPPVEDMKDAPIRPPVVRPTAVGPLHPPPPLLPQLWPSLPLLQHQLSLRALTSKFGMSLNCCCNKKVFWRPPTLSKLPPYQI